MNKAEERVKGVDSPGFDSFLLREPTSKSHEITSRCYVDGAGHESTRPAPKRSLEIESTLYLSYPLALSSASQERQDPLEARLNLHSPVKRRAPAFGLKCRSSMNEDFKRKSWHNLAIGIFENQAHGVQIYECSVIAGVVDVREFPIGSLSHRANESQNILPKSASGEKKETTG